MNLQTTDYLVAAALAAVALFPAIAGPAVSAAQGLWSKLRGTGTPTVHASEEDAAANWRNQWVQTLMELQADLESRGKQQAPLKLCKQLIWEIIGGGPLT